MSRFRSISLLAPLVALLLGRTVAAAPVAVQPPATASGQASHDAEDTSSRWYGYKILVADALSLGVLLLGAQAEQGIFVAPGMVSVLLAAPGVHGYQGNGWRALGSLGLRVGLPLAGAALATRLHDRGGDRPQCHDCMGGIAAAAQGMGLGLLSAMVLDAALLAWETDAPEAKRVALVPTLAVAPGGGALGLTGRF